MEATVSEIEYRAGDMRLTGWVCAPEFHRSQSDLQFLFLNGRVVRDRQLSHAVRTAYAETIPTGRYPVYVLYLELDPAAADVNVHPTKHEVRFRHARDVHDFLLSCLRATLGATLPATAVADAPGAWNPGVGQKYPSAPRRSGAAPGSGWSGLAELQQEAAPRCLLVAGRYLVQEREDGLWLADGMGLCRAWFRQRILAEYQSGAVRRRPLLVPVQITVTELEAERLVSDVGLIARTGFELQRAGPTEIMVREFPLALSDCQLQALVRGLIPVWVSRGSKTVETLLDATVDALPDSTPMDVGLPVLSRMLREQSAPRPGTTLVSTGPWRRLDQRTLERLIKSGSDA